MGFIEIQDMLINANNILSVKKFQSIWIIKRSLKMNDFRSFKMVIQNNLTKMTNNYKDLFVTDVNGDTLWDIYIWVLFPRERITSISSERDL